MTVTEAETANLIRCTLCYKEYAPDHYINVRTGGRTKRCSRCRERLARTRNKPEIRERRNEYMREYYRDVLKPTGRVYYQLNRERILENQKRSNERRKNRGITTESEEQSNPTNNDEVWYLGGVAYDKGASVLCRRGSNVGTHLDPFYRYSFHTIGNRMEQWFGRHLFCVSTQLRTSYPFCGIRWSAIICNRASDNMWFPLYIDDGRSARRTNSNQSRTGYMRIRSIYFDGRNTVVCSV